MNKHSQPALALALTIILLTIPGYPSEALEAASFDCNKAKTRIEKTICGNPSLDRLDAQLGSIYKETLQSLGWDGREDLKQDQRTWLKSRAVSCSKNDAPCLQSLYSQRIAQINSHVSEKIEKCQSGVVEIETIKKRVNPAHPPLTFKIYWTEQPEGNTDAGTRRGEFSMIEVYNTQPEKILQRVIDPENRTSVYFEDYNFDGYLDFRITGPGMILGNVHADVLTFDPQKNRFTPHRQLSELTSIEIDRKQKRLYSLNRSQAGWSFTYQVLTFVANTPVVLVKRTSNALLEDNETYLQIKEERFDSGGRRVSQWSKKIKADLIKDSHFPLETISPDKLP